MTEHESELEDHEGLPDGTWNEEIDEETLRHIQNQLEELMVYICESQGIHVEDFIPDYTSHGTFSEDKHVHPSDRHYAVLVLLGSLKSALRHKFEPLITSH